MKISIIGAGNVGSLAAMRIVADGLGDVLLIDVVKGLALGKALDLEDARPILKIDYNISGSEDINDIQGSDIVVITAGLARKPGMTREELISKNANILKGISLNLKKISPAAIVIVVTNPLDLMTYLVFKLTGFKSSKVFGMGPSLDSSRFANLISQELKLPGSDINALVIGIHGEGMLPLIKLTTVKGVSLDKLIGEKKIEELVKRTVARGAEIVAASGSAFFAPSAAIAEMVRAIVKDEKKVLGACVYLNGEYGMKDIYLGTTCCLGKSGIEKVIQLELTLKEKEKLAASAKEVSQLLKQLPLN
ncbi:MAG: malate dehydrogenase [Candidatus Omnitrophica bacterium]|nr:malate dehydrogenase [Candidatus Omnitrophota bacterium]